MIHQPVGGYIGQASDVKIHTREILELKSRINELIAKHTGKSFKEVQEDTERDLFMSAKEAIEYGLIDKIYYTRK